MLNGSTLYEANRKAAEYAAELGIATVGSSDCHVPEKLGLYATYFPREIRSVQAFRVGGGGDVAQAEAGRFTFTSRNRWCVPVNVKNENRYEKIKRFFY